jgi:hypothetical protein
MTEEERQERSISRRTALKRMGAAGAIAWATPVISSMHTPAYAESPPTGECPAPPLENPCFGQTPCGGVNCWCVRTWDGAGFCHQSTSCGSVQSCTTSADCPSGWACAYSCCAGLNCLPPCSGDAGVERVAAGGQMSGRG